MKAALSDCPPVESSWFVTLETTGAGDGANFKGFREFAKETNPKRICGRLQNLRVLMKWFCAAQIYVTTTMILISSLQFSPAASDISGHEEPHAHALPSKSRLDLFIKHI